MIHSDVVALVLAGGMGTRFGSQKQFLEIEGKPLWQYVHDKLAKFVPINNVCVVGIDVSGGETRSQSVINGLKYLKEKGMFKRVVILEAARPLITEKQIEDIIIDEHPSCTYALPLRSTVIKRDGTYLNREELCKLSTPVAFDYRKFLLAYLSGEYLDYTDDTRVMYEAYGDKPYLLEGGENMLKLTYPSDIVVFENLLKKYEL